MNRNMIDEPIVAVLLRCHIGPQIEFDRQRIVHPTVSQILPIVTDGSRISPIGVYDKGKSITTVNGTRTMQRIRRQRRIQMLRTGSGMVRDLEGEGGFESSQDRHALLVPDGPHLALVGAGQSQSGGTAGIDARGGVGAMAESCLSMSDPGAGLVDDVGFDCGSGLDTAHFSTLYEESVGEVVVISIWEPTNDAIVFLVAISHSGIAIEYETEGLIEVGIVEIGLHGLA